MSRLASLSMIICFSVALLFARADTTKTKTVKTATKKAKTEKIKTTKADTAKVDTTKAAIVKSDSIKAPATVKRKKAVLPKKPSSRSWVKDVLGSKGEEKTTDTAKVDTASAAASATAPDTVDKADKTDKAESPYETMLAQKKEAIPLLVMRPISEYGVSKLKNVWILHLCEMYLHFRLQGIPGFQVVSPETLSTLIPRYKEYNQAIPVSEYTEIAKKISAPYVLYLQCAYNPLISGGNLSVGKEINFLGKVSSVTDNRTIASFSDQFSLKNFGETFDQFIMLLVKEMGIEPDKQNLPFLEATLVGEKAKSLKKVGEFLSSVNSVTDKTFQKFIKKYTALLHKNPDMLIGYYAGAQFCDVLREYAPAVDFANVLIQRLGNKFPPAYIMAVRYYRLMKKYDQALKVADRAKDIKEIQNQLRVEKARCYSAKGDYKQAAKLYEEILKHDENNVAALLLFARKCNKEGKASKALSYAKRLLALEPDNQKGLMEKSRSLIVLHKFTEALKPLKRITSGINPDHEAYELIGDIHAGKKEYLKAIESYTVAISLNPKKSALVLKQGDAQIKAKKIKDAAQTYTELFALDSKKYAPYMIKAGLMLEKEKDIIGAKALYLQFLEKGPHNDTVNIMLAQIEYNEKGYAKTISHLKPVKKAALTTSHTLMLGVSYYKTGKGKEAIPYLKEVAKKKPGNEQAVEMLARVYDKMGDGKQAVGQYEKYLTLPKGKKNNEYAYRVGKLYEKQKRTKEAITRYTKNIKLFPKDIRNYVALSLIYFKQESYTAAQKLLKKAEKLPKAPPAVSKMLAKVSIAKKDTSSAIVYCRKYLKSSPNDSVIWLKLALFYFAKKNYNEAVKAFEKSGKLINKNPDNRYKLGFSFHAIRVYKKALPFLEEKRAEKEDKAILRMLADCYKAVKNKRKLTEVMNILSPPPPEPVKPKPVKQPEKKAVAVKEAPEKKAAPKPVVPQEKQTIQKAEDTRKPKKVKEKKVEAPPVPVVKTPPPAKSKIIAIDDTTQDPLLAQGRGLVLLDDYGKAKDFFMQMLMNNKTSNEMLFWMFRAYALSGDFSGGKRLFLNNYKDKNSVWSLLVLGEIDEKKSSFENALIKYKAAFKAAPENEYALAGIGRMELRNKKYQSALESFSKAFAINPENIQYCYLLGKCYEGVKQYENALGYYDEVLSKTTKYPKAFDRAGRIYLWQGLPSRAIETYTRGISVYPTNGRFYLGLGIAYKKAGKTDEAISQFQKALKMGKQGKTIEAYRYLGEIYYVRPKKVKTAEKYFKKYVSAGGSSKKVAKFKKEAVGKAENARAVEEARLAEEEARKAEDTRIAEEAGKAEEARIAEEARLAEEARRSEAAREAEKTKKKSQDEKKSKKKSSSSQGKISVADELKKFADLRDQGIITEEEFQKQKKKLLSQ